MKARWFALIAAIALVATAPQLSISAPVGPGAGGGSGICPNPTAPDADGDGIPNGQDPDYLRPNDGLGRQWGRTNASSLLKWRFKWMLGGPWGVLGMPMSVASGYGPGDGSGNGGVGPADGTGYGPGPYGDGTCDGPGSPQGYMRGPRN